MKDCWLAIRFPRLPLELSITEAHRPAACMEQNRIRIVNPSAQEAGIEPGMRLATAKALCQTLLLCSPDPAMISAKLKALGQQFQTFTPTVCLGPPHSLLMEIGSCTMLFGGLQALCEALDQHRTALPYYSEWGLGPTPLAAWHLTATAEMPSSREAAHKQLSRLPIADLALSETLKSRLMAPGFRTLADLLALPRSALARRFGAEPLDWLDKLLGNVPDPRQPLPQSREIRFAHEFDTPVENWHALIHPQAQLLSRLMAQLQQQQLSLKTICWHFSHRDHPQTRITVRRATPCHDAHPWLSLTQYHQQPLAAAVEKITLTPGPLLKREVGNSRLFADPGARPGGDDLLDRLSAQSAIEVYQLSVEDTCLPEHRQRLGAKAAANNTPVSAPHQDRPLWLLPRPFSLGSDASQLYWQGQRLHPMPNSELLCHPWANAPDRQYRIAQGERGVCCWVFRDKQGHWWLHGFF